LFIYVGHNGQLQNQHEYTRDYDDDGDDYDDDFIDDCLYSGLNLESFEN